MSDDLLSLLTAGDEAAVDRLVRDYEPYLRMVVRRRLGPEARAKFDSLDIVQSVWLHVLRGCREAGWRFHGPAHLRAFLVQLTRHRLIDRLRRHRKPIEHERPLEDAPREGPTAHDAVEAGELWDRLMGMCPPAHREILRLKRDGAGT
ncbi:MAG: RNA polymerase sigma factor, partial [Gemmataceae bacterium]